MFTKHPVQQQLIGTANKIVDIESIYLIQKSYNHNIATPTHSDVRV